MAKTRQKKVLLPGNITRQQAEDAFAEFAEADARQQRIQATMDMQITKIREKYSEDISRLTDAKDQAFDLLHAYAENNRDEFGKKKSLEFTHGMIGFRTGTPKLKTLKGFTWASVLTLMKKAMPDYVRTKEEPNKEALLADREKPAVKSALPDIGVMVDQDETFFVEPKKEEVAEIA